MECSMKILNNYDVLLSIFDYLDFGDHLKLIKICPQFEDAIVHGVWRLMYNNLNIQQSSRGNYFILWYNAGNNVRIKCYLIPKAIHKILHHSSMYIRKLELEFIHCLENIISFNYHHLTELLIRNTNVGDTHLQQVAENCLNLQSFTLIEFTDDRNKSNIRPNVFGEMKALNKLKINDIKFNAWNNFDLQQLFCLPHLKTLIIDIDIRDSSDNKGNDNNSTVRVNNIENLTIGKLPYLHSANVCFIKNLKRFENLTKLSIIANESKRNLRLDDNDLTQINIGCPKLCELSFTRCDFRFKEFPCMTKLKHLTFREIKNIGFENFDEIFRKLELRSLSVIVKFERLTVEAENISNYRYTSNTLEALTISDGNYHNTLKTFFNRRNKFENVSKVTLSGRWFCCPQSLQLCFSHNFPNLKELIMDCFHISSEDILHLKYLKVLKFDLFDNMSWSYLKILFKHPTLTHITITPSGCQDFEIHYEPLPNCCEGLTTKLEYLCLPYKVYKCALNFWPDFQQRNKLLKLEVDKGSMP